MELFALYNHPCSRDAQVKYYTVKVPLRVQPHEEGIPNVEANWLDHMTQHFNNGASLVDGYFQLGDVGNGELTSTFTCSDLADAFVQSDVQGSFPPKKFCDIPLTQRCSVARNLHPPLEKSLISSDVRKLLPGEETLPLAALSSVQCFVTETQSALVSSRAFLTCLSL